MLSIIRAISTLMIFDWELIEASMEPEDMEPPEYLPIDTGFE